MQTTQGTVMQSLRAVQTFLDANATVLGVVVTSGARKSLDETVSALDGHAGTQSGSYLASQSATQQHYELRRSLLRDHMVPIAKIAAAQLPKTPELSPLRIPPGRPAAEELRSAALGMAKAAAPYAQAFIDAGLPADFLAQLTAAADAMVGAIDTRTTKHVERGGATEGLKTLLSAGRKYVHALDAMVKSALKDDPARLVGWNIAKRVRIVPSVRKAAPDDPTHPTTPTTTPTTTTTTTPTTTPPTTTAQSTLPTTPPT